MMMMMMMWYKITSFHLVVWFLSTEACNVPNVLDFHQHGSNMSEQPPDLWCKLCFV